MIIAYLGTPILVLLIGIGMIRFGVSKAVGIIVCLASLYLFIAVFADINEYEWTAAPLVALFGGILILITGLVKRAQFKKREVDKAKKQATRLVIVFGVFFTAIVPVHAIIEELYYYYSWYYRYGYNYGGLVVFIVIVVILATVILAMQKSTNDLMREIEYAFYSPVLYIEETVYNRNPEDYSGLDIIAYLHDPQKPDIYAHFNFTGRAAKLAGSKDVFTDLKLKRVFAWHNFKKGTIWINYTVVVYGLVPNSDPIAGKWGVSAKLSIKKTGDFWEVTGISEES